MYICVCACVCLCVCIFCTFGKGGLLAPGRLYLAFAGRERPSSFEILRGFFDFEHSPLQASQESSSS